MIRVYTVCHSVCIFRMHYYHNDPKFSDTQNICCNHSKVWTMWLYHTLMSPNNADGMANSVDPDQTAPLGAVWSGSALFVQAYLSENLGSLRYMVKPHCSKFWKIIAIFSGVQIFRIFMVSFRIVLQIQEISPKCIDCLGKVLMQIQEI